MLDNESHQSSSSEQFQRDLRSHVGTQEEPGPSYHVRLCSKAFVRSIFLPVLPYCQVRADDEMIKSVKDALGNDSGYGEIDLAGQK